MAWRLFGDITLLILIHCLFEDVHDCDYKYVNFKHNLGIDILSIQVTPSHEYPTISLIVSKHQFK